MSFSVRLKMQDGVIVADSPSGEVPEEGVQVNGHHEAGVLTSIGVYGPGLSSNAQRPA